jgi:hypothetical protein
MPTGNQRFALLARETIARHGLVTRQQMVASGASRHQILDWCHAGLLQRVEPEVFLVAGHAYTWRSRLLAQCLVTGGLASHRSAAALLALEGFQPGPPEITVTRLRTVRHRGVRVHESTDLHLMTPTTWDGIPVTPVARTLLDLGAVARPRVEPAVLDAVSRRLTTWPELWRTLQAH